MKLLHWSEIGKAAGVVLTVPAGASIDYVRKFHVHACPHTKDYDYQDTQFMACRGANGIVERIYELNPEKVYTFLLNPAKPSFIRDQVINQQPFDNVTKDRVRQYVTQRLKGNEFEEPHDLNRSADETYMAMRYAPRADRAEGRSAEHGRDRGGPDALASGCAASP